MEKPFISERLARRIGELRRRGEATSRMVGVVYAVQLHRLIDGVDTILPPVEVRIEYPDLQANRNAGDAGSREFLGGEMIAWAPWDVKIGDAAVLPGGDTIRVEMVEPELHGIIRARFSRVTR